MVWTAIDNRRTSVEFFSYSDLQDKSYVDQSLICKKDVIGNSFG
ncbi:hypothetical protein S7335_2246 [Synechococcus sp. PCC 7335]|nr:hypothetical protein S7335_2246 [Synechococcus sp. PCC 7335]